MLRSAGRFIENQDSFMLPVATIFETGNLIVNNNQINGNQRRAFAQKFVEQVTKAHEGNAPWKILSLPSMDDLISWLKDFPNSASGQISLGDHTIIKTWEQQAATFPSYSVHIGSLDSDLQGYSS
ncbi:MAG: hypothetical protein KF852_07605 [Saprospiraceae bacterium]|nr:hypothetical protein [Saprospiraceae bacterium]